MATTGTFGAFQPQIADLFDEAFELAGVDPSSPGTAALRSAFRSLRLLLNSEWATLGIRQWMIRRLVHDVSLNETAFTLPAGTIDVISAVLRRSTNRDTEMFRISRDEYLTLHKKDSTGRPDRFYVDRLANTVRMVFWQAGSNATDQIVYDAFCHTEDVGEVMMNTLAIPQHAHAALTMGLASKLALKFNTAKFAALHQLYCGGNIERPSGLLGAMITEDRERGDIDLGMRFEPRTTHR